MRDLAQRHRPIRTRCSLVGTRLEKCAGHCRGFSVKCNWLASAAHLCDKWLASVEAIVCAVIFSPCAHERGVSLRVRIHQQDAGVRCTCRAQDLYHSEGNVGGRGGLSHTSLIVGHNECASHELPSLWSDSAEANDEESEVIAHSDESA